MLSIPLGPLALPAAPLLLLLTLWVASTLASRLAARTDASRAAADGRPETGLAAVAGDAFLHASLLGLATARIVHVAQHAVAYGADPWSMLDLRDGGWHAASGTVAGLGWLAARARRTRALARALAAKWQEGWGQQVIVDNKGGGGGCGKKAKLRSTRTS
jgi:prolipoprotein diacylglyceryltransferase